jgi:hypothetical protein
MASKHRPLHSAPEQVHNLRFIPSRLPSKSNLVVIVLQKFKPLLVSANLRLDINRYCLNRKNNVLNLIEKLYPSLEPRIRQRYGI